MKKYLLPLFILLFMTFTSVCAETTVSVSQYYDEVLREESKLSGDNYITRAEFISVLMKSMGYTKHLYVCSFYDVRDADWNYVYTANAEQRGIALGTSDGAFLPNDFLSIEEAVTFASRAYKINPVFLGDMALSGDDIYCSEYADAYIKYAVASGIYPKNGSEYVSGDVFITTRQALQLIEDYRDKQNFSSEYISFISGYPKVEPSGKSASIGIVLKVNKPCRIFSKVMPAETTNSAYTPERTQVNSFLTSISAVDTEIRVNIPAEQMKSYNIFFTAVDEYGAVSKVYALRDVSPLPYLQGKGTKNDPYKIYSAYQLERIKDYPDKHFVLCNDIAYNNSWEPIGARREQSEMFSGTLDGKGYSITGLEITGEDYVGLFAALKGGTVKNLNVSANVRGSNYVGTIAGEVIGGTIENCHTAGFVKAEDNIAGGIVGKNNGTLKNCVSAVYTVTATAYAGGVAGSNVGNITSCISAVTSVYGDMYASSIAGINTAGVIQKCVGACIEVSDTLTKNSGRITTNRESGSCKDNYVYEGMISGEIVYINKDGQDGEEVLWEDLTEKNFYEKTLGYRFSSRWCMGEEFLLPCIKGVAEPHMQPGLTVYAPLGIGNETELNNIRNNLNGHYFLKNDIALSAEKIWVSIGLTEGEADYENGFRGTLDGRGHTISNLHIEYNEDISQYGLFGTLYGASVRNLHLTNVDIEGYGYVGTVAGVNYGVIKSCTASGNTLAYSNERETLSGGICAKNYTNIYSCDSRVDITVNAISATAGGIAAQNEGYIYDCSYNSTLVSIADKRSSNSVLGGICGINYSGMIYNCFAGKEIISNSFWSYCGGICGIADGGEIYMCSSYGNLSATSPEKDGAGSYTGGIVGMTRGGLVMNSFTQCNLSADTPKSFMGGIAGYGEGTSIQNVYTINTLRQGKMSAQRPSVQMFAGGIIGYNDSGSISGAVAINPYILTEGYYSDLCAYSAGGYVDNNYSLESMYFKGNFGDNALSSTKKPLKTFNNIEFFLKSVAKGGELGWTVGEGSDRVWTDSAKNSYPFPVLNNVKNQEVFYLSSNLKNIK